MSLETTNYRDAHEVRLTEDAGEKRADLVTRFVGELGQVDYGWRGQLKRSSEYVGGRPDAVVGQLGGDRPRPRQAKVVVALKKGLRRLRTHEDKDRTGHRIGIRVGLALHISADSY